MPSPSRWWKGLPLVHIQGMSVKDLVDRRKRIVILPSGHGKIHCIEGMILALGSTDSRQPFRILSVRHYNSYDAVVLGENLDLIRLGNARETIRFLRKAHAEGDEELAPEVRPLVALLLQHISKEEAKHAPR